MPLILSIETATATCSVALHKAGELIAHRSLTAHAHAECLMEMIAYLLKTTNHAPKRLAALAVSSGPGSYTGLRIGATVGKGLCYGLSIPLIAIPTLEAMVEGMRPWVDHHTLLCPAVDARRAAIYTLMADKNGCIKRPTHVALLDNLAYQNSLPDQPLLFFGDGAIKCKSYLQTHTHIKYMEQVVPSAVHMGMLAWFKFQAQCWENTALYQPLYLSQFST